MRRYFRLARVFTAQTLKSMMEYKADFFTGMIGFLMAQLINILFLKIIFSQIPSLVGWSFSQIVFIYGFSLLPKGLDHLLTDNLWEISFRTIAHGEFDRYLIRPVNPLMQVLMETFQVDAFGELLLGVVLLCSVMPGLHLTIDLLHVFLFIVAVVFGTLIYTALKVFFAALSFWIKMSGQLMYMFYMLNDAAKYPVTIYNRAVRIFISYIVPFAFTAYFPASYFLRGTDPLFNIGGTALIAVVMMAIAYTVWCRGIRAYESAGS